MQCWENNLANRRLRVTDEACSIRNNTAKSAVLSSKLPTWTSKSCKADFRRVYSRNYLRNQSDFIGLLKLILWHYRGISVSPQYRKLLLYINYRSHYFPRFKCNFYSSINCYYYFEMFLHFFKYYFVLSFGYQETNNNNDK